MHAQLQHLHHARFEHLAALQVEAVLVLALDEARQRLAQQPAARQAEQAGCGRVGGDDHRLRVERAVAHRRELVQVVQPRARGLELFLRASKLLVLHLELDLVHMQLVHHVGVGDSRLCRRLVADPDQRALAQRLRRIDEDRRLFLVRH